MKIRKGDSVFVLTGKDSGKTGIIEHIFPKKNTVIVHGLNLYKKHQKPSKDAPHGGIVEISMPINSSNLSLICTHCKKTTRIKAHKTESTKQRICRKCGESL